MSASTDGRCGRLRSFPLARRKRAETGGGAAVSSAVLTGGHSSIVRSQEVIGSLFVRSGKGSANRVAALIMFGSNEEILTSFRTRGG